MDHDLADSLWEALKELRAATPDKSQVKRLVVITRNDIRRAVKLIEGEKTHAMLKRRNEEDMGIKR